MTHNEMTMIVNQTMTMDLDQLCSDPEIKAYNVSTGQKKWIRILKEIMKEDVASFRYLKADGSQRDAYGTRCSEIIDSYIAPQPQTKPKNKTNSVFTYFDIEKGAWRCMIPSNLMEVNTDYVED